MEKVVAAIGVVTRESARFALNGDDLHAFHVSNAHADGDATVHFVCTNVVRHPGILGFGLMGGSLCFVPILDRPKAADAKPSKLWSYLTYTVLVLFLTLTYLAYTADSIRQ